MRRNVEASKIIWQSKTYPWMTFTQRQLEIYREKYPRVQSWKKLLEELEAWVVSNEVANPSKIPTPKGWGNFLNNCARRRNKDIVLGVRRPDGSRVTGGGQTNAEYYGKQSRGTHASEPTLFGDVLKKLAEGTHT